jgi:mono/diheme cytochrome c family protein
MFADRKRRISASLKPASRASAKTGRRMNERFLVRIAAAGFVAALGAMPAAAQDYAATLKQYCVTCHSDKLKTADLSLESMDLGNVPAGSEVWEKVIRKLRVGMMPPQGLPHPDAATRAGLISYLETSLDRAAALKPNPGRNLVHRLNRTEYANAIRDLLALDVDPTSLLPPDDSGYGFDNIADVLGVSPVLLERYVAAAGKISALAVGDPNTAPGSETFRVRQDASQDVHIEGLPLGTIGGILIKTTLPLDGEYIIDPKFFRNNLGVMRGLEYPHECETTVDDERIRLAQFGGDADFKASLANMTMIADEIEGRCRIRVKLKAGPRQITVAFLRRSTTENTLRLQPFIRSSADTFDPHWLSSP